MTATSSNPARECQPDGDTWRPIDTAPKDGTAIWLLLNNWPYIGYYEPADEVFKEAGQWFVKASFRRRSRDSKLPDEIFGTYDYGVSPTHWQPLPEPPRSSTVKNEVRQ